MRFERMPKLCYCEILTPIWETDYVKNQGTPRYLCKVPTLQTRFTDGTVTKRNSIVGRWR